MWRCDNRFAGEWYRFMEPAGTVMPTEAPPIHFRCGADFPMWMVGSHPTLADSVVSRQACAYLLGNTCVWSATIQVRACLAGYFVYKLPAVPACSLTYCGTAEAVVSVDLTLVGEVFTEDLNDKNHPQYQRLAQVIVSETSQAFSNVSSFIQATVRSFRAGSVIATVDIKFQNTSQAPSSDVAVLATLQQYISDNEGRLGNLSVSQVDVATVNHCQPDPCVYGTCISGPDNYICTCDEGYEGETCNIYIGYCKKESVDTEVGQVTFPRTDGGSFSYSAERCNSSAENEKPVATRFCRITTDGAAVWDQPVLLTCDTDLQNLSQVRVYTNLSQVSVYTKLSQVRVYTNLSQVSVYTKLPQVSVYTKLSQVSVYTKLSQVSFYTKLFKVSVYTKLSQVSVYTKLSQVSVYTKLSQAFTPNCLR
ncbi:Oncoprotein-induced transcript 3 protein [Branchiostoma belcheri]|nr:Oncoprotein-induced transcript 3 protein [Branchiostoma belcheri]